MSATQGGLHEIFHLSFQRAAALQQTPTKDAFVPLIEMDQNLLHSTYQSAVNLKDVVKLSAIQCREKRVEGTVSLENWHFLPWL